MDGMQSMLGGTCVASKTRKRGNKDHQHAPAKNKVDRAPSYRCSANVTLWILIDPAIAAHSTCSQWRIREFSTCFYTRTPRLYCCFCCTVEDNSHAARRYSALDTSQTQSPDRTTANTSLALLSNHSLTPFHSSLFSPSLPLNSPQLRRAPRRRIIRRLQHSLRWLLRRR